MRAATSRVWTALLCLFFVASLPIIDARKASASRHRSASAAYTLEKPHHKRLAAIRAGATACSDANAVVLAKVGVNAALETAALWGILYAGTKFARRVPFLGKQQLELAGLPLPQWMSILAVVFGSSFWSSLVDGSVSAATQQALDPNGSLLTVYYEQEFDTPLEELRKRVGVEPAPAVEEDEEAHH